MTDALAVVAQPCPWCGGTLEVTPAYTEQEYHPGYHNAAEPLPTRLVALTTVACTGCEYMVDAREFPRAVR